MAAIPLTIGVLVGGVVPIEQLDDKRYRVRQTCCDTVVVMTLQSIKNRRWAEAKGRSIKCYRCGRIAAREKTWQATKRRAENKAALADRLLREKEMDLDQFMDILHHVPAPMPEVEWVNGWPSLAWTKDEVHRKQQDKKGNY